jgi:hypothetical protein
VLNIYSIDENIQSLPIIKQSDEEKRRGKKTGKESSSKASLLFQKPPSIDSYEWGCIQL